MDRTQSNLTFGAPAVALSPPPGLRVPAGIEPSDVLGVLLGSARAAGSAQSTSLWLEDPATSTLRLIAAIGDNCPDSAPVAIDGSILGEALASASALLGRESRPLGAAEGSWVWRYAVPLDVGEARGVAVIDLGDGGEPDAAMLNRAAAESRVALSGALALHVARSETATARGLIEATLELSRLLDPDAVMRAALRRAMLIVHAQTGSLMLRDASTGRMRIAASSGLSLHVVHGTEVSEGEGIAGWVLASGQPLVVEDLSGRGPRSHRHGVRSAITVPIADDDGALGVINVGNRAFHARFSQSHLDALSSIGRATAVALRSAWAVHSAQDVYFDTLKALSLALETKDPYARRGTERVVAQATALGDYLGLTPSEAQALRIAAMLRDVGMSAAGQAVAVSDRPLSTVEWGMLKLHPLIAADILARTPALAEVIPIVTHHHEHFDGNGYTLGLSGGQIPLGARILAVADAYVAMTSERPYRHALSHSAAVAELLDCSGSQFDPDIVTAFIELDRGDDGPARTLR